MELHTSGDQAQADPAITSPNPGSAAPYWVRLTRHETTLSAATFPPTALLGPRVGPSTNITMASSAYAGPGRHRAQQRVAEHVVLDNVSASFLTNVPPMISWVVPANNSTFIQPKTITLTASATDADGTVTNVALFKRNKPAGHTSQRHRQTSIA